MVSERKSTKSGPRPGSSQADRSLHRSCAFIQSVEVLAFSCRPLAQAYPRLDSVTAYQAEDIADNVSFDSYISRCLPSSLFPTSFTFRTRTMAQIPPMDEILRLKRGPKPETYESIANPVKMGNQAPIAYGGCAMAVAVMAAFHSLPTSGPIKALYSLTCVLSQRR